MRFVIVMVGGLLLGGQVAAADTAGELLGSCEAVVRTIQHEAGEAVRFSAAGNRCWYYMQAVQDLSIVVDSGGKAMLRVCAPEDVRLEQFVRVFTKFAENHPEKLHHRASVIALQALWEAFPCK